MHVTCRLRGGPCSGLPQTQSHFNLRCAQYSIVVLNKPHNGMRRVCASSVCMHACEWLTANGCITPWMCCAAVGERCENGISVEQENEENQKNLPSDVCWRIAAAAMHLQAFQASAIRYVTLLTRASAAEPTMRTGGWSRKALCHAHGRHPVESVQRQPLMLIQHDPRPSATGWGVNTA